MNKITINGQTYTSLSGDVNIINGRVIIDGKDVTAAQGPELKIKVEGSIQNLKVDRGSVECGDVGGDVDAGGSVSCGNVSGEVDAGGSVNCGNVGKSVDAGGSVNCSNVEGSIDAGGSVICR